MPQHSRNKPRPYRIRKSDPIFERTNIAREKQTERIRVRHERAESRADYYRGKKQAIVAKYEKERGPLSAAVKKKFLDRTFWDAPLFVPHWREYKLRTQSANLFMKIFNYKKHFEATHRMIDKKTFVQHWRSPKLREYPWEELKQEFPKLFTPEGFEYLRRYADYLVKRGEMTNDFFLERNKAVQRVIRQFQKKQF